MIPQNIFFFFEWYYTYQSKIEVAVALIFLRQKVKSSKKFNLSYANDIPVDK